MGLFGSASGKQVDELAKSLALELAKQYPQSLDQGGGPRLSQRKLTAILEGIYSTAIEFRNQHKLGVYKKARLGNTFRWELEEMGYSKKFIETATEGLIVYITRK